MKVAIRLSDREELKAIPILYRHSPGMILPGGIYVISTESAAALRDAGVMFDLLCREGPVATAEEVAACERL